MCHISKTCYIIKPWKISIEGRMRCEISSFWNHFCFFVWWINYKNYLFIKVINGKI